MKVVEIEIDKIKPYWRNPRKISVEAVEAVKSSINRFGFNVPIVLDMDGVIIAGHTRYKAMVEMGHKLVPCVYSDMGPKKAKEYRIADNKTAELANWDVASLKLEMRELDIIESIPGFSDREMDTLLKDINFAPLTFEGDSSIDGGYEIQPGAPIGGIRTPAQTAASEKDVQKFDKKESEMNNRFSNMSQETQSHYVQIQCPHCAGDFVLDKRELER